MPRRSTDAIPLAHTSESHIVGFPNTIFFFGSILELESFGIKNNFSKSILACVNFVVSLIRPRILFRSKKSKEILKFSKVNIEV